MPVDGVFKERLMSALHSAVGHFNDGATPNEAVMKSATANDFNVDQTSRLAETFNTARTIYHYKNASDRTSSFELAEPGVIIPAMFKPEAPAKEAESVNHDYSSYDIPEAEYSNGINVKSATGTNDIKLAEPTDYLDTDLNTQSSRAFNALYVQRDLANTARDEARIAGTKAAQLINKVAADISRGYEEDCQDRYNRLVAGYGSDSSANMRDQWAPVVSKLAEFVPGWLSKGAEGIDLGPVVDDRDLGEYTSILKEAKEWMEAEAEMLAVAGELDKEADAFECEWMAAIQPVLPEKEASTLADFINPSLRKAAQTTLKREWSERDPALGKDVRKTESKVVGGKPTGGDSKPGVLESAIAGGVQEGIKGQVAGGVEKSIAGMLGSPTESENIALSDRLKNVQRQIMLEELITNDPVLSEESPEDVAAAYSAIVNMAPELASNKEVVRAILRQSVHAVAIDPYTAKDWTELEKNIRNITGKTPVKEDRR